MAVPFESIQPELERLRNFVLGDLRNLIEQETGGNYLAAALIACACEPLSHMKYGVANRGELFFADLLPLECGPLAFPLYGAIRNGIVHLYDTQTIRFGSRKLEIVISWRKMPHLHLSPDRKFIYVNVKDLATALGVAMDRFESDLKKDKDLREICMRGIDEARELWVTDPERAAKLEICLASMKIGPTWPSS